MKSTSQTGTLELHGVEDSEFCPHIFQKWDRIGNYLYRVCKACGEITARDVATAHPVSFESLGNQYDAAEARAWRDK